jgi:hypothetical protein
VRTTASPPVRVVVVVVVVSWTNFMADKMQ